MDLFGILIVVVRWLIYQNSDLYIKTSGLYLNQNFKMQKKGDIVRVDFHIPLKMSIAIPLLGIDPRKLKTYAHAETSTWMIPAVLIL